MFLHQIQFWLGLDVIAGITSIIFTLSPLVTSHIPPRRLQGSQHLK
jgi:hypothetical protein